MYRYLPAEARRPVFVVARMMGQEFPRLFEPIRTQSRPHVSILSRKTALTYLSRAEIENPFERSTELLDKVYESLQPGASEDTEGVYESVDMIGTSLGLVLESPRAFDEIDVAYNGLGQELSRKIGGDRRPHVTAGYFSTPLTPALRERVLDTAADICAVHLPYDRRVVLEPISFTGPGA